MILAILRPLTIVRVVVSMTLKIENINYFKISPEVAVSKVFLTMTLILENIWVWASNISPGVESLIDDVAYHLLNHIETWQSFGDKNFCE